MKKFKIIFSLLLLTISPVISRHKRVKRIVGGNPAAIAPEDDPLVFVNHARKSGTVRGVLEYPHYVFRGVRFAHPPTGRDRFQRPKTFYINGDLNATVYPPACLQEIPTSGKIIGKEDCLFLNVYTPMLPEGREGLPVLVWIHPGGFRFGSASQFGVRHLLRNDLIVVSIQYRLGSLGFLSVGAPELPGNVALFDMAAGVEWTRRYISFFGGNPHRITIMGHGSGASSALLLALSNIAKGRVNGVIAMSGSALSTWAVDNTPMKTAKDLADYQGCPTVNTVAMIRCLQNVDAEGLIKADSKLELTRSTTRGFISSMSGLLTASPVQERINDGRSLPSAVEHQPMDDLTAGRVPQIPLLTGITKFETKRAVEGRYKEEAVNSLQSIPNFLETNVVPTLKGLLGLGTYEKNSNKFDPLNFLGYLKTNRDNVLGSLGKVSEITTDTLFGLPAFLTADLWSKTNSSVYMYRFEHFGNAIKSNRFLKGIKLVDDKTPTNDSISSCSHGDDLSYLFEPKNLDGSDIDDAPELTETDVKVKDIYTKMIADFVRNGKLDMVPSFKSSKNNFVQISAKPKISDDFNFCQMGLWAGIAERLQSATCQVLNQFEGVRTVAESSFNNTVNMFNPFNIKKPDFGRFG